MSKNKKHFNYHKAVDTVYDSYRSKLHQEIDPHRFNCPSCGVKMEWKSEHEITGEGSYKRDVLICPNCDCRCRTRKSNSGKVYLQSTPAGAELRALRQEAHIYFDMLYKYHIYNNRNEAYLCLSKELGIPLDNAESLKHIGEFNEEFCKKTIEFSITKLYENIDKSRDRVFLYKNKNITGDGYARNNEKLTEMIKEIGSRKYFLMQDNARTENE